MTHLATGAASPADVAMPDAPRRDRCLSPPSSPNCVRAARARARPGRRRPGETVAREQADAHDHCLWYDADEDKRARLSRAIADRCALDGVPSRIWPRSTTSTATRRGREICLLGASTASLRRRLVERLEPLAHVPLCVIGRNALRATELATSPSPSVPLARRVDPASYSMRSW